MGEKRFRESGDNWKLTKDGKLINDGKAELYTEIVNDDGSTGWSLVAGSEKEKSVPAALVHYLGKDRAALLLGGNPQGMSDELIGESLMKGAGIAWDANRINPDNTKKKGLWIGGGSGLTITDKSFYGNAAMRSLGNGLYERYSITGQIYRSDNAYDVYKNGVKGKIGEGNTKLEFTKWNLDTGKAVGNKVVSTGVWNSVDNSYGQLGSDGTIGADQPYKVLLGPLLQGNTIAAGSLNMRWAQVDSRKWGERMFISDTYTIAGDYISSNTRRLGYPGEDPWLLHYTNAGSSDGCFVSIGEKAKSKLMNDLKDIGMYRGYSISSTLKDRNRTFGYKKGKW